MRVGGPDGRRRADATAKSSLWSGRRFKWRLFLRPHRIPAIRQWVMGSWDRCILALERNLEPLGQRHHRRARPGIRPSTPTAISRRSATTPTSLNSISPCRRRWATAEAGRAGSEEDFRPERIRGIFAPPPLFLAFQLDIDMDRRRHRLQAGRLPLLRPRIHRLPLCRGLILCGLPRVQEQLTAISPRR